MSRPSASVPPEAIRIEDEVWQEAFARREPARSRRLHSIEGGRPAAASARSRPADIRPHPAPAARPAAASMVAPPALPADPPARWEPSRNAIGGVPGRRTVTIRGHGAERSQGWPDGTRRRPPQRAYERAGFKPDRVAMWAVLLGILLVVVAVASAH